MLAHRDRRHTAPTTILFSPLRSWKCSLAGALVSGNLFSTGVALHALLLLSALAPASPPAQPNVIIVLADDLGWGDLSCYRQPEAQGAQTPQLDAMAAEGVRFGQCYSAAPICSPSRCGIITGQFPARSKITSFLQTKAGNAACEMVDFLNPAAPSLPRQLRAAGYATAHVGKWHLGGGRDVDNAPNFAAYGYDMGVGTWESPAPHPSLTAENWVWSAGDPVKRWDRTGWMVDQTLQFLADHADRPCFVNLWLDDPHTPWVPSEPDQQTGPDGRARGAGDSPEKLAGVLAEMDRQIGRLLAHLRKQPPRLPTLVIFLSDNGPLPTFAGKRTAGLRGSKLSLYEGGIRVPGIVWGPGIVQPGIMNTQTVLATVDLLPSLCTLCGAHLPPGSLPDGEDLSQAMIGAAQPMRSTPLCWEYGRNETSFHYPQAAADRSPPLAVRVGAFKLLVGPDGTTPELYDISADATESTNLAATQPDRVVQLRTQILAWRNSVP